MTRTTAISLINSVILFAVLLSCTTKEYVRGDIKDQKYDSEFPHQNASDELERISESIKLINCMAFYRKHVFTFERGLLKENLTEDVIDNESVYTEKLTKLASGTGTIIDVNNQQIVMLTAAHILHFADTLISYYSDEEGKITDIVQSISFKLSQNNYSNIPEGGALEVIMLDTKRDVALVGKKVMNLDPFDYTQFNYPLGDSDELTWGNFVYVFGFPVHNKMLTRAIVSRPNKRNSNTFMIDAVLNRGSSGGIVLAIRDGVPNFELVGIISWMNAKKEFVLKPMQLFNEQQYQVDSRYEGSKYIGELESIMYGITKVITIEAIKKSIQENAEDIKALGYSIPRSFIE